MHEHMFFRFAEVTTLRSSSEFTPMSVTVDHSDSRPLCDWHAFPSPLRPVLFRRSEGAELIDSVLDVVRKEAEGNTSGETLTSSLIAEHLLLTVALCGIESGFVNQYRSRGL